MVGEQPVRSFARQYGVSEGVLRAYLLGTKRPGVDHLVKLADAGGVAIDWLATGRVPKKRGGTSWAAPKINIAALAQALAVMEKTAVPGETREQTLRKAVEFYAYMLEKGMITADGEGAGDGKNAA
ncbi:MAG TPA: helix-turn-helix transcriptional regulator [Rhodocyclaceae bacterium]